MAKKETKTNAVHILERNKITFEMMTYECDEFIDGIHIADKLGIPHEIVYKTIVTVGKSKGYYVFVLPIEKEIDFKKAAKSVGREIIGNASVKRFDSVDRLCERRLYFHRNEKTISDGHRPVCI